MATLKRWNGTAWRPVGEDTYAPVDDPRFDGIGGGTVAFADNGDGTFTITSDSDELLTDHGDGTFTLTV